MGFYIIKPMNSLDKTAHLAAPQSREDEITRLTELVQSLNSTLRTQEIKIQALVQEVAYLRRIRYGVKSETMSAEQRSLFEDDVIQDIAAVESELDNRQRRQNQGLVPVARHCPNIWRGSTCATNRTPAPAQPVSPIWSRSAKMSASSWILNRHASL